MNVSGRRRFVRHARAKGKDAILLMVFVGPVVATVILVRWLTDGNGAAELLGSVSAALGVVLVTRRQRRHGRWPWGSARPTA